MAGTTPEIKTRFTLDGMQQAVGKLRAFGQSVVRTFDSFRGKSGKALEPLDKGAKSAEKAVRSTTKSVTALDKKSKETGKGSLGLIKLGALAAVGGVAALALKITGLGAAAIKSSKDTAEALQKIGRDARRLGQNPGDLSVLAFAGRREGVDQDEISVNLAHIAGTFKNVRNEIARTRGEYQGWYTQVAESLKLMRRNPAFRSEGNQAAYEQDFESYSAAAQSSIDYIENSLAKNFNNQHQIRADDYKRRGDDEIADRLSYLSAQQGLVQQRDQIINSFGPEGQALYALKPFGLDIEKASKGGTEGLVALSDAMSRVPDAAEKVRLSMLLFGEDAGPKMLTLMNKGRKGIEEYRAELERLGGVVSKTDVDLGEKYQASAENLRTAISGVKLEVARQLLPSLTDTNVEITEWLVKSRQAIATYAKSAFISLKTFAEDAISLFRGDTSNIKTQWLDTVIKKTAIVRDAWADVRLQIDMLTSGQDSDYAWVNTIRDYLLQVKAFAVDAWSVIAGGDAKDFPFLNELRDQVVAFGRKLSDAWDLFKGFLSDIRAITKPVLDFFGIDPTTFALFLGIAKLTGVLGGVMTAVKLLSGAFGGLFSLGGGALAAGAGAARAGAALGGAAATAGGFTSSLLGVQTALGGIARAAGVMGVAIAGGFALGQKAAEAFQKFSGTQALQDQVIDAQTKLMRDQGDQYMNMRLGRREERDYGTMRAYYGNKSGQDYSWLKTSAEQAVSTQQKMDQLVWGKPMFSGADAEAQYRANMPEIFRQQPPISKRVQIDINAPNGLKYPVFTDDEGVADGLTGAIESYNRR
ncbi:hypothetical protein E0H39_29615 [Rhizobium leguminosarum bv. viciae]|uniref:hypothetical protein n=1 Tax=Rhizobium leguminosarum TaxID=384 RepID=UPI001040D700|nr:hypothetical protein [Rhizobium leguminosarum]TBY57976.1 hypothetical protein E0H39_29615 [Rhizobium leguminosarum bv. viciae]